MVKCLNCYETVDTICADHGACLACHENELRHLARERDNAYDYIKQAQAEARKLRGERTWGERIIGSMWNPGDKTERDDINKTCESINSFLGYMVGGV